MLQEGIKKGATFSLVESTKKKRYTTGKVRPEVPKLRNGSERGKGNDEKLKITDYELSVDFIYVRALNLNANKT